MERFGPTRRGGPVFRWLGEDLSIDLANTVMVVREGAETVDLLADEAQRRFWLAYEAERLGLGRLEPDVPGLARLCELRDAVRDLFAAAAEGRPMPSEAIACLNASSAEDPCVPQLRSGMAWRKCGSLPQAASPACSGRRPVRRSGSSARRTRRSFTSARLPVAACSSSADAAGAAQPAVTGRGPPVITVAGTRKRQRDNAHHPAPVPRRGPESHAAASRPTSLEGGRHHMAVAPIPS